MGIYQYELAVPSAARGTSGSQNVAGTGYHAAEALRAYLDVTAASGTTPTLDVKIEDSPDGGTTWFTVASFAQKTGITRDVLNVVSKAFGDRLRVTWTIGGTTPSFTFSVRLGRDGR